MSATTKRRGPNAYVEQYMLMALLGLIVAGMCIMWVGAYADASVDDKPSPPAFPPVMVIQMINGTYTWPGAGATAVASAIGFVLVVAGLVIWYVVATRTTVKVDRAAPYLAQPKDLHASSTAGVRDKANRMGIRPDQRPGVFIGRKIGSGGGMDLWGSWEDMHMDVWGPRTGKTATRAIPNIVAAPGACIVTSNKRDVVDATRGVREQMGRVWIFDPQNQGGNKPTWWWNPLSYVKNSRTLAVKLATRMSSVNRPAHARSDAYFEPAAEELIADLLLAACAEDLPMTVIYTWLTRPSDETPVRILRDHGHILSADAVDAVSNTPTAQRMGVYGTALQIVSFLTAPGVLEWITPGSDPSRPQFDYLEFIKRGCDTLYLLSEETNRMAAPLVLAFTAALAEDAENYARDHPGGRLPVPMLIVLDEAANVCPWKQLPDKYTHFGSRGIVIMTIIQSWAQGSIVWGSDGMKKLWGAANCRVYGGGVSDTGFLGDLSQATGPFEAPTVSTSQPSNMMWGKTVSRATRQETVLDVADLTSMPRGRALVQFSGTSPVLVRTVPWWETPYRDGIQDSIDRYDPGGAKYDRDNPPPAHTEDPRLIPSYAEGDDEEEGGVSLMKVA